MTIANIRTSAGTTLSIAAAQPATFDAAGYGALTFTEIAEVSNLGDFGRVYNEVTFNPLGTRQTVKRKGSFNEGNMTLEMARDPSDPGQLLLITARDSDVSPSFLVTTQDGTKFYFTAQVLSYTANVGTVDNIFMANANVSIDTRIVEVAAV